MDIKIKVTVRMYMEEKTYNDPLVIGSDNYGIMGRAVTVPLREINGKEYRISNVQESFTVKDLWDWIERKLQEYKSLSEDDAVRNGDDEIMSYCRMYLVFNGLRYMVEYPDKSLFFYIHRMGASETDQVSVQILISANAGEFAYDDGIRYYMKSREAGSHHEPHVHVKIKNGISGSFSIRTGDQLADGKIRGKYLKKIKHMIMSRQKELVEFWNLHTDGLKVDINQAWGLIDY